MRPRVRSEMLAITCTWCFDDRRLLNFIEIKPKTLKQKDFCHGQQQYTKRYTVVQHC